MDWQEVGEYLEHHGVSDEDIDAFLEHHGVKGQKWGVRHKTGISIGAGVVSAWMARNAMMSLPVQLAVGAGVGAATRALINHHAGTPVSEVHKQSA